MARTFLYLIGIPLVSIFLVYLILSDILPGYSFSSNLEALERASLGRSDDISLLYDFYVISKYLIISGVLSLGIFYSSVFYSGIDRAKNALIFPKLIPVLLVLFSSQIAGQVISVMGILYFTFTFYLEIIPTGFIFIIGLGGIYAVIAITKSIFSMFTKDCFFTLGKIMSQDTHQELYEYVNKLSYKVKSEKPDNIIVGLEPNFYVTSVDVETSDGIYKGKTLYLSLPLMNLLSMEQLNSIIGHELGHFKADDVEYSKNFSPVYKGLGNTIVALEETENIAIMPLTIVLNEMLNTLALNQSTISREREFLADKVGVEASSPEAFSIALTKIVIFSEFWEAMLDENRGRIIKNRLSNNLSDVFIDCVKYNLGKNEIDEIKSTVLSKSIYHPLDTHPIVSERINNVDYDYASLSVTMLQDIGLSSDGLFQDKKGLELELTDQFQMLEVHKVEMYTEINTEDHETDDVCIMLYSMAAAMVAADGIIDQKEMSIAEDIGANIYDKFDRVDFRSYVSNLDIIPSFADMLVNLKDIDIKTKKMIYDYLLRIANSDGEFHESEKKLLDNLTDIWKL